MPDNALPDDPTPPPPPRETPLAPLHRALGARFVTFAGYAMPLQFAGIIAEHAHTRAAASLFDVSHMGQAVLHGAAADAALERLVPGDVAGLRAARMRYTLLLNEAGGIRDDLMAGRLGGAAALPGFGEGALFLVCNASRKDDDAVAIAASLPAGARLAVIEDRALLALQGPLAAERLAALAPDAAGLPFLGMTTLDIDGAQCLVSRSGYTGEDGFEISVPAGDAERVARALLDLPDVLPAGLGARDTLRLEAGFCLHGNDIDELTTTIEAGLGWTIGKRRRAAWDFAGGAALRDQHDNGAPRRRVGLRIDDRALARAGTMIVAKDGTQAGAVTSGTLSPTLGVSIAMGYVRRDLADDDTELFCVVRGRNLPARVVPLPFVPHRTHPQR